MKQTSFDMHAEPNAILGILGNRPPRQWKRMISSLTGRLSATLGRRRIKPSFPEPLEHVSEQSSEQEIVDLRHQLAALKVRNSDLEVFSQTLAHELRGPLRNLCGYAALLKSEGSSHECEHAVFVDRISALSKHLDCLVRDILELSAEHDRPLSASFVDLNTAIGLAIEELGCDLRGGEVRWSIDEFPTIRSDRVMVTRILTILLSNALKYSSVRPEARISILRVDCGPSAIGIAVTDNGVGFDPAYRHKLFTPFERLHSKRAFEGVGLGLSTAKRFADKLGGRITAEGAVDAGATFTIFLPTKNSPET